MQTNAQIITYIVVVIIIGGMAVFLQSLVLFLLGSIKKSIDDVWIEVNKIRDNNKDIEVDIGKIQTECKNNHR